MMRDDLLASLEEKYRLPEGILAAVQHVESRGNPKAVSPKGALGAFQFMPDTAAQYRIDPLDPVQAADGAARMLRDQLKAHDGSLDKTLASYNWGQGNVERKGLAAAPPETVAYLQSVKARMAPPDPAKVKWDDRPAAQPVSGAAEAPPDPARVKWEQPAQAAQQYDPTEGMTGSDKFFSGMGKAVSDLGSGVKQLGAEVGNKIGLVSDQTLQGIDADVTETKRRDAALMNTGAGIAGNIGGNVAMTLLPLGGLAKGAQAANAGRTAAVARALMNPTTAKAALASGALQGMVQPVAEGDSRALNTAVGGAAGVAGNALINGLGRVAQPFRNALSGPQSKAVQTLQAAGVPLDAAQQSGSPFLNRLRSVLADNPFTMNAQSAMRDRQGAAYNNALLKTIGEGGPEATSDVMGAAQTRINAVFKDVLGRNDVPIGNPLLARIGAVQAAANEEEKKPVAAIANRLLDSINRKGEIPGQIAYGIKKDLDRLSGSADTTLAHHARQLRSAVMDGINDALPAADKAAFAEARGQFRNMKALEGAIDKEGLGQISPARLANIMGQKANRGASVYGRGDQEVVDLAQAGKQLLTDGTPNSGTAARIAMQAAPAALVGTAGYLGSGDPWTAAQLAGGVYAAPKLAQMLLNNPTTARYLANGLKKGIPRSVLLGPQNNALISAMLRSAPAAYAVPALRR